MRVLWVFAHPEPRSLNGSLRDTGVRALQEEGHSVRHSDLYAMQWDPVVRAADYGNDPAERLRVTAAARRAHDTGRLSPDVAAEQAKLTWADTVIVQFPLWWFGTPAILKGWFDRVFITGFAQGVRDPATGRTLRYGSGGLAGRRAMVVTTVGAPLDTIGPRGIHGEIHDVLFPLLRGTLWYSGMTVVPPLVLGGVDRYSDDDQALAAAELRRRLRDLPTTDAMPYRAQEGGDYDDARRRLRPEHAADETGLRIHSVAHPPAVDAPGVGSLAVCRQ